MKEPPKSIIIILALLLSAGVLTSCRGAASKKAVQAVEKVLTKTKKVPAKEFKEVEKLGKYKILRYGDDAYRVYNSDDD